MRFPRLFVCLIAASMVPLLMPAPLLAQRPVRAAAAQAAAGRPSAAEPALPVRRVVLYKTGVGYFEHLGNVVNRQSVAIRFTSAQLNDVLKSLTTIDLGNGQVTGVSYNSIAPMEQRLGALRLPLGPGATTLDVLASLRGARLEVGGPAGSVTGRLLSVERQNRTEGNASVVVDSFSLVTDAGAVRSFELTPSLRVRIAEGELRREIARYLDVVGSTREQDVRQMVITTSGSGERPLFVSYVSEVPIWKTTYRLVLREKNAKPLLQGWAIVDNTIGEDWRGVELSLVAGAPQSFIQNVSQPYYGRRPTVPLPTSAMMTPQTHQATLTAPDADEPVASLSLNEVNSRTRDQAMRSPRVAGNAEGGIGGSAGGGIYRPGQGGIPGGTVGGTVGGLAAAPPPPAAPMSEAAYSRLAMQSQGTAAAPLGDLFEYRIKEPVTLQKDQSALVPIVNAEISAEKVGIWNRGAGSGRPLRAVWLTNGSGLTLDGGSIAVIDGNAFAGEGLIESLKPGERRLLSYAADLGVLVKGAVEHAPARIVRIRARDGIVVQESEDRSTWTYTARSEEDRPVTLVIEHAQRPGWKLAGGPAPAESTPDAHRFRILVEPRKEATLVIHEMHAAATNVAIDGLLDASRQLLVSTGANGDGLQRALAPLIGKRAELASFERTLATLNAQLQAIVEDQQRLRENLKALRGSAEEKQLLQRYTRQLDDQENRLEALRKDHAAATASRDKAREELNALIANFSYES